MSKIVCAFLTLMLICFFATAQPGKNVKKPVAVDPFCDSIQLILKHSKDGYIGHRFNEKQASVSIGYNTVLPLLGFEKRYVQTGIVTPHKKTASATLPYYMATSGFPQLPAAIQFFNAVKNKLRTCLKPVGQDSMARPGYTKYTSFQVSKAVKDSFITIELILLPDPTMNIVALRIFHSKGSLVKGNMKNPPTNIVLDKNHYNQVLPLIKALMGYAPNNFVAVRKDIMQNQKWKPTYTSIVHFREFPFARIEYVTDNLWNQYVTELYVKDEEAAKRLYDALAEEIEQCKSSFAFQRYDIKYSTALNKWWYYDNVKTDAEGKTYKNTINLTMVKFEYGEGYYVKFEFRKSVG